MGWDDTARAAQRRVIEVFRAKPASARDTASGRAELGDGFACTYSQGGHSATMDMPDVMGGTGQGPSPGFFGRAGLAGCVAIGIKMSANRAGLDITSLAVDIEQDFDNRGMFGVEGCPAAPVDTRLTIRIESPAPVAEVDSLVRRTLEHDPWFLAFRDSQSVSAEIAVSTGD